MKEQLTRNECSAMRGIAILAIILHNYCHWINGIVKENEYTWQLDRCSQLWQVLQNPDYLLPVHLVSFFGHYGVPVFLFLSGFGLVKKYEQSSMPEVGIWRFVRYNYLKLFRILIVGFVAFTMLDAITPNMHRYLWHEVVAILGMFANVLENPSKVIWPGPYWYFSLTLQLYIVYRLVLYRWRHWGVVVALIAGCWLWQLSCQNDMVLLDRIRYNFIGGMLPFGMGILFARIPTLGIKCSSTSEAAKPSALTGNKTFFDKRSGKAERPYWEYFLALLVSTALIVVMSFWYQSWLWVPAFIVVGTIALVKVMPNWMINQLVWVGSISAAMFVAHPIVRKIFINVARRQDPYDGLILYIVATIALSWLVKLLIDRIPKPKL